MSWEHFVEKRLLKPRTFEEGATEDLLHLIEGYGLVKMLVTEKSHLNGKSLMDFKLPTQGILVLGIERGKHWIPIPKAREVIQSAARLVVYGTYTKLSEVFSDHEQQ